MFRLKYGLTFSLLICVLVALPLLAQSDDAGDCDIDLSEIAMMLIQAQDAAGSGDNITALDIIADAEAEIEALREACGGALGAFDVYTTEDGAYRFIYPAAWVFVEQSRNGYVMATSEEVIELLDTTTPTVESGMQGVGLLLGNARQVGGSSGDNLAAIVDTYATQIEELGYNISDRTSTEVNGNPAVYIYFDGDGFTSTLVAVELATEDTFAVFTGTSAQDEYEAFDRVLQGIVESLEPAPVSAAPEVVLPQNFIFDDGSLSFDYPEGWVIGQEESFGGLNSAFLGTSMSGISEVSGNATPTLNPDEQVLLVLIGEPQDIADFESENLNDLGNYFVSEGLADAFTLSIPEDAQYGDAAALEFTITGGGIAGNLTIVELVPEATYAVFVLLSNSDGAPENARLLEAIVASVRFPSEGDPLGLGDNVDIVEATPTAEIPAETTEEPVADVELGETLEEDFFSFDYPAGWVFDDDQYSVFVDADEGLGVEIALGTSQAAIDLLTGTGSPTFEAGQVGLSVLIGAADLLSPVSAEVETVEEILTEFEAGVPFEVFVLETGETQGELVFGDGENVVASIYMIEVEPGLFAAFIVAGMPSDEDDLRALAASIADSFTYDAEAVAAEIDRLNESEQDGSSELVPTSVELATEAATPTPIVVTEEVQDEPTAPVPTAIALVTEAPEATEAIEEEATPEVELDATLDEVFFSFDYPADWIIDEDTLLVNPDEARANVYLGTSEEAIESVLGFDDVLPEAGDIGVNVFIGPGDEFGLSPADTTVSGIIDVLEEFLATDSSLTVIDRVDDGDRGLLVVGNVDQVATIRITQLDEGVFTGIIAVGVLEDEAVVRAIVDAIEASLTYDAEAVEAASAPADAESIEVTPTP